MYTSVVAVSVCRVVILFFFKTGYITFESLNFSHISLCVTLYNIY